MAEYRDRYQRDELIAVLRTSRALEDDSVGHIDLRELDLGRLQVTRSVCRDTSFAQANLEAARLLCSAFLGVEFRRARLAGSLVEESRFDQARLMEADFSEGTWSRSFLKRCMLSRTRFQRTRLVHCTFQDSDLTAVNFEGAHLAHCRFAAAPQLGGANLARSKLAEAVLIDCDFKEANFREADLRGAFFLSCDLRGTNLREARLEGAAFLSCNAEGADLVGAGLSGMQHAGTRFYHAKR